MPQNKPKTTIVRGPDGTLYYLTKGKALEPLPPNEAQEVHDAVPKIEQNLEATVAQAMSQVAAGCTQRVRIAIPDVDI